MAQTHNLYLAMYAFKIKKRNTSNKDYIKNNDFLEDAYPDIDDKFKNGFIQDIIRLIDSKTYKNKQETHGAILEQKFFSSTKRILDILINGGLTGIKQYIIDFLHLST